MSVILKNLKFTEDRYCFSPLNISTILKRQDIDKLSDNVPHKNIISCTCAYSKLNTKRMENHSLNVSRFDFTMRLMQQLSRHLRKQIPFSPHDG